MPTSTEFQVYYYPFVKWAFEVYGLYCSFKNFKYATEIQKDDWVKVIATGKVVQVVKYIHNEGATIAKFMGAKIKNPDDLYTQKIICRTFNAGRFSRETFNENELELTTSPI